MVPATHWDASRVSVAPMLDWTDAGCRFFHRLLTRRALLYTEMVTTGALLHGDVARHLAHEPEDAPVALQLGGSDPADLARCARLGQQWGYQEINLNCGCPSPRVQRGAFGACLMLEADRVADAVKAMLDAVSVPVTVKHRIGVDEHTGYGFVRDFIGRLHAAGCTTFIIHARSAWLQGLSPKENREIPPLCYETVYRIKREFPQLRIVLNGGVKSTAQIQAHLQQVDGVMVGREAYANPWWLAEWDATFWPECAAPGTPAEREAVELAYAHYMARRQTEDAVPWPRLARHMLGLRQGLPGARLWRQVWSDHRLKSDHPLQVLQRAHGRL